MGALIWMIDCGCLLEVDSSLKWAVMRTWMLVQIEVDRQSGLLTSVPMVLMPNPPQPDW